MEGTRLEAPEDFSRLSDRVLVSFKGTEFELRSTSRPFKVAMGVSVQDLSEVKKKKKKKVVCRDLGGPSYPGTKGLPWGIPWCRGC